MKTLVELPLLPLRDVVVYPHMVIPLFVGREKSIEALEAAMTGDKQILLLAQKNPADDDPGEDGLYRMGTVATVLQLLKLPDGTVKVLVEGEQRGQVERFIEEEGHIRAAVQAIDDANVGEREAEVFTRSLLSLALRQRQMCIRDSHRPVVAGRACPGAAGCRDRPAAGGKAYPRPGQEADGAQPARVLPE